MSLAVVQRAIGEAARLVKSRAVRAIAALNVPSVPISTVSRLVRGVGPNRMFGSYYILESNGEYPADYLNYCFELFCDVHIHDLDQAFANTQIPQYTDQLKSIVQDVVISLDRLSSCEGLNGQVYDKLAGYHSA